jgi:hypothetical protein
MTPHPKTSRVTAGVAMKRSPVRRRRGPALSRLAEQEPKSWPRGTELHRWRHREVHLQRARQQEHPVGGQPALKIDKLHRVELLDERAGPPVEYDRWWAPWPTTWRVGSWTKGTRVRIEARCDCASLKNRHLEGS